MGKKRKKNPNPVPENPSLSCELCGKPVILPLRNYVSGATGKAVCKDCLNVAQKVLPSVEPPETDKRNAQCLTPQQIMTELDKAIIGQDRAKKAVAIALWKQQLRAAGDRTVPRTNLLLYGPTGCGKTAIVREAARIVGLPFLSFDATTLTEAGYRGRDARDMISDLQDRFGEHPSIANSVIFLDEIDKLAAKGSEIRTQYNRGTQHSLLKLVEGTEVDKLSTETMLFIFGGAFTGLATKTALPRMRPIGFENTVPPEEGVSPNISVSDFIRFGMEPELMGRVGQYIPLEPLSAEDMERILLESELSLYRQYQRFFLAHGIRFEFSGKRMRELVQDALERGTGARGLNNLVEEAVEPILLRLAEGSSFEKEAVLYGG